MKGSLSDSKLFSQAASKWRMIGHLLNIPSGALECMELDSQGVDGALSAVFTFWRRKMCSPYSWKTVLKVLATDAVGHKKLADDIAHILSGEIGHCMCTLLDFISHSVHVVQILYYRTMLPL